MGDSQDRKHEDFAKEIDDEFKDLAVAREERCGAHTRDTSKIPEVLIEKIIARMPFPTFFMACCLSKTWNWKFCVLPSPGEKSKSWCSKFLLPPSSVKSSASCDSESFRKEITLGSSKWPNYCPTYVSKDGLFTFDKSSHRWRDITSFTYLPPAVASSMCRSTTVTYYGSLMCVTSLSTSSISNTCSRLDDGCNSSYEMFFVTNLVTKCWKELPCCPGSKELLMHPRLEIVRILPQGVDSYRVLSVYRRQYFDHDQFHTYIYDSELETSTAMEPQLADDVEILQQSSPYVDGKLYCLGFESSMFEEAPQLWVYDIDENSWMSVSTHHRFGDDRIIGSTIVLCGDRVMLVTQVNTENWDRRHLERGGYVSLHTIKIYEVVRGSLRVEQVPTEPPPNTWGTGTYSEGIECAGDADFLYFGLFQQQGPVLRFNMHSHKWDTLPYAGYFSPGYEHPVNERVWGDGVFEPGLNPFITV